MIPSNQPSSRFDDQVSFSDNFEIIDEDIKNETNENESDTINVFDSLMKKFNICHDKIFANFKITNKVKKFEKNSNIFNHKNNTDFKNIYYPDDEAPDQDQTLIPIDDTIKDDMSNIENIPEAYKYFYKNMSPSEYNHIKNIEQKLNINFIHIETSINKIKERITRKWDILLKLEKKIKKDCQLYDKNFKMIQDMKDTIGENYTTLNESLSKYIDDLIEKNNMIEDIKKYKLLIMECNFLKNCVSKYHSIQIMKKNSPICKICFTNISNLAIIPCGHLICNKCLILHKAQSSSLSFSTATTQVDIPTSYSITLFNTDGTGSTFNLNGPSNSNTSNNSTQSQNNNNSQLSSTSLFSFNPLTTTNQNTTNSTSNSTSTSTSTSTNTTTPSNSINPDISSTRTSIGTNTLPYRRTNIFGDDADSRRVQRRTENNRRARRRIDPLDRRIQQRRIAPSLRKTKCPFCRNEFDNTCKLFF